MFANICKWLENLWDKWEILCMCEEQYHQGDLKVQYCKLIFISNDTQLSLLHPGLHIDTLLFQSFSAVYQTHFLFGTYRWLISQAHSDLNVSMWLSCHQYYRKDNVVFHFQLRSIKTLSTLFFVLYSSIRYIQSIREIYA